MFPDNLSDKQLRDIAIASSVAIACYDSACADPQVKISTPLHAAMLKLRQVVEGK